MLQNLCDQQLQLSWLSVTILLFGKMIIIAIIFKIAALTFPTRGLQDVCVEGARGVGEGGGRGDRRQL